MESTLPRSSSPDRPVFKSNNLAQFQGLNSVRRWLVGSSGLLAQTQHDFLRGTINLLRLLLPRGFRRQALCALPCSPVKWGVTHLAGSPGKVIRFSQKAARGTVLQAFSLLVSSHQQVCKWQDVHHAGAGAALVETGDGIDGVATSWVSQGHCHPTWRTQKQPSLWLMKKLAS